MTEYEKKRLKLSRITAIAVILMLAVLLVLAVSLWSLVYSYESRVDKIVTDLETVTAQLSQLDVEHMVVTLNGLSQQLGEADLTDMAATLNSLSRQLESIPWAEIAANINGLAVTGQESLTQVEENLTKAMESLNSMDFETLNKAIADLQAVVEPLAKLMDRFS